MSQGMIQSFKDEDTAELFQGRKNRRWQNLKAVALRKLDMIDAAAILTDLRVPPGIISRCYQTIARGSTVSGLTINTASVLCGKTMGPMK